MDGWEVMHSGSKPSGDGNPKTGSAMVFGLCSSARHAP